MTEKTAGTTTVVGMLPISIWIEKGMTGEHHVVVHHQGVGKPFTYATFYYDYAYTSNTGTRDAAHRLALALGAQEPIETRTRRFEMPTADEVRKEIESMQSFLATIEAADTDSKKSTTPP